MYYYKEIYLRIKAFEWDNGNVLHIELGHEMGEKKKLKRSLQ